MIFFGSKYEKDIFWKPELKMKKFKLILYQYYLNKKRIGTVKRDMFRMQY